MNLFFRPLVQVALFGMLLRGSAGEFALIVEGGEGMPDGNGIFSLQTSRIEPPVLNNQGLILFYTEVSNSDPSSDGALVLASPLTRAVVARTKNPQTILTGYGNGQFDNLGGNLGYALGDLGNITFTAEVQGGGGTVLVNSGTQVNGLILLTASGFSSVDEGTVEFELTSDFQVNIHGQVAQLFTLTGTDAGTLDNLELLRFDLDPRQQVSIGQKGDGLPETAGAYTPLITETPVNRFGQVALMAQITGTGESGPEVILRGDGTELKEMIRSGDPLPGGGSVQNFDPSSLIALDDLGRVAVFVNNTDGSGSDAIVRTNSAGVIVEVARVGQSVQGEGYTFSSFNNPMMLNTQGDVVFQGDVLLSGSGRQGGVFKKTEILVLNDWVVPDLSGHFRSVENAPFALNEQGDVAMLLQINLTEGPIVEALYLHTEAGGLEEILREGDTLFGGTVTDIEFRGTENGAVATTTRNGFNDRGQVAFQVTLDDDHDAVGVWSPEMLPFPGSRPGRVIETAPGELEVQMPGLPGIRYQIESRESLTTGSWQSTGGVMMTTDEGVLTLGIPENADQLFLRSGPAQ